MLLRVEGSEKAEGCWHLARREENRKIWKGRGEPGRRRRESRKQGNAGWTGWADVMGGEWK